MLYLILYVFVLILELIFAFGLCAFAVSLVFSSVMGSPYVPTKKQELLDFLKEAALKKGDIFLELGCGDGRVVRTAVEAYGVKGVGVDINMLLILWAKLKAKLSHTKGIEFRVQNIFKTDASHADVIYLFLMPELIAKLALKLKKEIKKNCVVMSHGFKIAGWDKYIVKTIPHKPFPTYYYKIK